VDDADRTVSWKHLFSRALTAAPGWLHFAAHSHHLWPDASFAGQLKRIKKILALVEGFLTMTSAPKTFEVERMVDTEFYF
jgi:hypothetical protein